MLSEATKANFTPYVGLRHDTPELVKPHLS